MDSSELAVFVRIPLPDGTERLTRIGTAARDAQELVVTLEGLSLQPQAEAEPPVPIPLVRVVAPPPEPQLDTTGASVKRLLDLEQLAERSRKVLLDEKKARWHHDVRSQLELIETEIARLRKRRSLTRAPPAPVLDPTPPPE